MYKYKYICKDAIFTSIYKTLRHMLRNFTGFSCRGNYRILYKYTIILIFPSNDMTMKHHRYIVPPLLETLDLQEISRKPNFALPNNNMGSMS